MAEGQGACFADVVEQALVDRPPPWTSRLRRVDRVDQSSPQLPSHEGRRRLPVGKIAAVDIRRDAVLAAHQGQPPGRVVSHGTDSGDRDRTGRLGGHPSIVPTPGARLTQGWHRLTVGKHREWATVCVFVDRQDECFRRTV
jgi:hypothetical protein